MLTQKQLVQILGNPESYNIEITSSTTNMDKCCQAFCAFSNDLPGDDKSGYMFMTLLVSASYSRSRRQREVIRPACR